jgi:hypothetical protein
MESPTEKLCCGRMPGAAGSTIPPKRRLRRSSPRTGSETQGDDDASAETNPHEEKQSSSSTADASVRPISRSVSFNKIDIAEHVYQLGDNPSVMSGAPITISWEPQERITLDVDEYEDLRSSNRSREEMRLPSSYREQLAKESGASRSEVKQAIEQARRISDSRRRSVRTQHWDKLNYQLEKTSRTIRKVASLDGLKKSLGKNLRSRRSSKNELLQSEDEYNPCPTKQQNDTWRTQPSQLENLSSLTISGGNASKLKALTLQPKIKTEPTTSNTGSTCIDFAESEESDKQDRLDDFEGPISF